MGNTSKVYATSFEDQIISLVNSERQNQGLTPLQYSGNLFQAAYKHNKNMVDCSKSHDFSECFTHQISVISEFVLMDRVKDTGYNPSAVAENIAWGQLTPAVAVSSWMGSVGHKANILGGYKDIGCSYLDTMGGSYQGIYWTCVFGKSFTAQTTSPTSTPKPTPTSTSRSTPTKTPTPTLKPTVVPSPTITITPSLTVSPTKVKPWWCFFVPSFASCQ